MDETAAASEQVASGERWRQRLDAPVEPLRLRDPLAEVLGVLDTGEPFVVTYGDVVQAAGHSCPTAAGSFRIARLGLDALYPESLPVRGVVEVLVGGPRTEQFYGVAGSLVSYVTGAAGAGGFGGLPGGFGRRRDLLTSGDIEGEGVGFAFRRTDTGDAATVTYRLGDVPGVGPAMEHLPALVDGSATQEQRDAFQSAWRERVRTVLTDDGLFEVTSGWPGGG